MAKASSQKKPRTYSVTPRGLVIWGCVFLLAGGWFFLLGVLVGRGLVPTPFEADRFEAELAAQLADETATAQARLRQGAQEGLPEEPLRIQDLRRPQVDTQVRAVPGPTVTGPDGVPIKKPRVPPKKRPLGKASRATAEGAPQKATPTTAAAKTPAPKQAAGASTRAKKSGSVANALAGMQAKFTLQVASVREQAAAEKIVLALKKAGHPAYQTASPPGSNGVWYRVRVGAYQTRQAAETALAKFKGSRYKPIVIQR